MTLLTRSRCDAQANRRAAIDASTVAQTAHTVSLVWEKTRDLESHADAGRINNMILRVSDLTIINTLVNGPLHSHPFDLLAGCKTE